MLGRACPEDIRDGRQTVCAAGYSPSRGLIRLYPTRWDSPLDNWNIVSVEVERPVTPQFDGRKESWKIAGSRSSWSKLNQRIKVTGVYPRNKRLKLIESLTKKCVQDIIDDGESLGIVKPEILEYGFEKQEDVKKLTQTTIDSSFRVKVKNEYDIEPRVKYRCSGCRTSDCHDQQILEWGIYEWLRKKPGDEAMVWENLHFDDLEWTKHFLVGSLFRYPTSFIVVSVLRLKVS